MLELEALLLGLEPMTAAVIGVGALVLVPIVGALDSATGHNISDSARGAAKTGLMLGFDAFDKAQSTFAEASESFKDLVAEAKAERTTSKNGTVESAPHEVTIA